MKCEQHRNIGSLQRAIHGTLAAAGDVEMIKFLTDTSVAYDKGISAVLAAGTAVLWHNALQQPRPDVYTITKVKAKKKTTRDKVKEAGKYVVGGITAYSLGRHMPEVAIAGTGGVIVTGAILEARNKLHLPRRRNK